MQFDYMTDEEIEKAKKAYGKEFFPGLNDFTVKSMHEKVSAKGNTYISIELEVTDKNGSARKAFDNLPFTPNMRWKLKNYCYAVGHPEWFEKREIDCFSMQLLSGKCETELEEREVSKFVDGVETKEKRKFVKVTDYINPEVSKYDPKDTEPMIDDEIPF